MFIDYKPAPIYYKAFPSLLGEVILTVTTYGICGCYFSVEKPSLYIQDAQKKFARRPQYHDDIPDYWWSRASGVVEPLPLVLQGTLLQKQVWKELCNIPTGTTTSYQAVAKKLGKAKSTRAIASMIAQNCIGYLIPCHRVIRKDGTLGGYKWGLPIKKALLMQERKQELFLGRSISP